MARGLIWLGGIGASVAVHAGGAAALWWAIQPDPVTDQPNPETKLQMTAYEVARSSAQEAEPSTQAADEATPDSSDLRSDAVPTSRADAVAPAATALASDRPEAETAIAEEAPVAQLAEVTSAPEPIAATTVAADSVQAVTVPVSVTPASLPLTAVSAAVPAVVTPSGKVAPLKPTLTALPNTVVQAPAATTVALPETRAKAALAFPTAGGGPIDPVSLAAYQSFMEPGSLDSGADVKDGIAGFLSAVPCSRMQVEFNPIDNALIVVGHVPEDAARTAVMQALGDQMGADIPVQDNLRILPRPQCGALSGIASVGLPQSTDQITNPLLVGEDTHAAEFRYVDGQALVLDLQGADYDAFVYVDYFDAAGNVVHLSPNEYTPMRMASAKSAVKIGADAPLAAGETGLYIQIGPPYGQEIAVAFAASSPLYDGVRPLVEPAEPYLQWLRARVATAREADPEFKGEWVYFFVTTSAR